MTVEIENGFQEFRPSLGYRVLRALGFKLPYVPRPPETEEFPSFICTTTHVNLSFLDRLRLLVSGRLEVESVVRTSVEVPHAVTKSEVGVWWP